MESFKFLLKEYLKEHTYTTYLKGREGVHSLLDVCSATDDEGFCTAIEIVINEIATPIDYLIELMEEIRMEVASNE